MATLESRTTSPEAAFHKFTVEAWSLLSAALAITGIRIAFRVSAIGARHLCWDDYLVCVGAVRLTRFETPSRQRTVLRSRWSQVEEGRS